MTRALEHFKVAILVADGFEQSEMVAPRNALDQAGAITTLVSLKGGQVRSWSDKDWGDSYSVDLLLSDARYEDFDALLLPGGVLNPDQLRIQPQAVAFVRHFADSDKPIAAICHGPWTLINAGIAHGKHLTSWPSLELDLRNAGAHWVNKDCVVDGKLVTSRKPADIPVFNTAMIDVFSSKPAPVTIFADPVM